MVTAVELIYSDEFTDKVLHFIEHTDSFVQFGIRMFQHFTLSAKLRALISKSILTTSQQARSPSRTCDGPPPHQQL